MILKGAIKYPVLDKEAEKIARAKANAFDKKLKETEDNDYGFHGMPRPSKNNQERWIQKMFCIELYHNTCMEEGGGDHLVSIQTCKQIMLFREELQ